METILDEDIRDEFPEIRVCSSFVWPDCGDKFTLPDGRVVFICAIRNSEFIKNNGWVRIERTIPAGIMTVKRTTNNVKP